ncbi:MAG: iron-sulfur cluster assembly scaffold protein [Candidatus Magasanikbacteria bacterium]|nr:iron-sulfur cluster assembly scaffold protein [Candidatus Magasanikbacteria bacterium]
MSGTLYHEALLEIYKHPLNKQVPSDFSIQHKEINSTCGDEVEIFIKLENDRVATIGWQGSGCAISQASASLTTDAVKGKTAAVIKTLTPESVLHLLGLPKLNPTRLRCALLALEALKKAL